MYQRIVFIMLCMFSAIPSIYAHPHVKLTCRVDFDCSAGSCEGFTVSWKFDSYYSADLIRMFDKNRDGAFDEAEQQRVFKGAFSSLKEYGYFVFIRKGADMIMPDRVSSFKAWQKNGMVYYSFFVPVDKNRFGGDFSVAVFDRTFFCAMVYDEDPVLIKVQNGQPVSYKIAQNKKYPVYYNPLGTAGDTTVYKKWKPGLETAYPEEVQISTGHK